MRCLVAILLFLSLYLTAYAQDFQGDDARFREAFLSHYEFFTSLYPRLEGSQQERRAVEHIQSVLSRIKVGYASEDFRELDQGHSFSSSIYVSLPGALSDELLIVAPLNHREKSTYGQDGSVNLALALAFIEVFHSRSFPISIKVLFLGAEFGPGEFYPMGTTKFLDGYFPEYSTAVLYLDFIYPPERVTIRSGDRGIVSPYWLTEQCTRTMDEVGIFYLVRGNENQFYRLGTAENPAPLFPYLDNEYPAISFHSSQRPIGRTNLPEWSESFAGFLAGFASANSRGFIEEWDRHYLFFQARGISFLIGERTYIVVFISVLALLVLYPLVLPRRFSSYAASIFRNFWALPILLLLVYALLLIGTLLIEGLSELKGYPAYWETQPFIVFTLKISAAVFLFTLLSRYVKRIPFPRRGRFYTASALLLLFADILVLGLGDISLSYYVLWACIWAFFFSLMPNKTMKAICFIISMAWFFKISYDIFSIPVVSVAEKLILERGNGNLLLSFILFPFLLMLIRLDFMFRHPRKRTKRILLTVVFVVLGAGCGGLTAYIYLDRPFSASNPQPVTATEVHNLPGGPAQIDIISPARMINLILKTEDDTHVIDKRRGIHTIPIAASPGITGASLTTSEFLDRTRYTLTLSSIELPSTVELEFTSPDEIVVYDASFPFSYVDSSKIRMYIGRNPPNPLTAEFTVPADQKGSIDIKTTYSKAIGTRELTGENIDVTWETTVERSIEIGGPH